jgi:iron(III) transport system ATP-binding protein
MIMPRREPAVEIVDVVVRYGDVTAVDGVSLRVDKGRHLALIGPSGCGKTTLLRTIAGFERPACGIVRIGGTEASGSASWIEPEKRHVGMVFQQGALFPHLTVLKNVAYGLDRRSGAAERAAAALELVGLVDLRHRYPDELSGGQQQRVALARALAPEPHVILLDEPFASLDAALRVRLRDEVAAILAKTGMTSILVTHDREEAFAIADEVAVMHRGRILQSGPAEDVYNDPVSPAVSMISGPGFLLDCEVEGGRATTVMGTVATSAPSGRGCLLVRPEDIVIASNGDGASCQIVRHRFRGSDVLCEVRLDHSPDIPLQFPAVDAPGVGARVSVRLREKSYRVLPGSDTDRSSESSSDT